MKNKKHSSETESKNKWKRNGKEHEVPIIIGVQEETGKGEEAGWKGEKRKTWDQPESNPAMN